MAAPLLLLALSLVRADGDSTLHLPRNGAVAIDTRTRDVVVHAGSGDVVTVRGAEAELRGGTLRIDDESRRGREPGLIEITVPAWARIEVSSVGGSFTLTGPLERLHAETVTGSIHLTGGTGTAELESVAGEITVTDFHGVKLSVDAPGKNLTVTNATGAITVDDVNGSVFLRGIHSSTVSASSINGAVEFEGPLAVAGRYDFNSQNGNVTLWLSGDVSAQMDISTMIGDLSTEIPATTNGLNDRAASRNEHRAKAKDAKSKGHDSDDRGDERSFTVVYGSGAARVSIDVFNGSVIVKRMGPH